MKKSRNRYVLWVVFKDNREVLTLYEGTLDVLIECIKFWNDDNYILTLEEAKR